jgi:hypothetical protein
MIRHAATAALALALGASYAMATSTLPSDGIKATGSAVTVPSVTAEKAGYIVVHTTDFTGTLPGAVIGHAPVPAGESTNVSISLERAMKAGAKVVVMLHEEGDGDADFDSADKPATSSGATVQQIVTVE